jgi:hypothetical protein
LQKKEEQTLAANKSQKTGRRKNGKVAEVYAMHQRGIKVKEIAKKMKIGERVVRSYVWRAGNPDKFKALIARYQKKRKERLKLKETPKET